MQDPRSRKKSPSVHHRTTLSGYIFSTNAHIYNWKTNLLNSSISSTCSHYVVNFGLLAAEIFSLICGTPANFNGFRVLASLLQRCRLGWYTMYSLPGLLPHNGILPGVKFALLQVLHSPILPALLHGTRAAVISQTLWRGTRNEITELSLRAPPRFGWAAITLGISPHSS